MPFTTECGHSFCYDCLQSWFENKMNCPVCRREIENKPVLNIKLKEVSKNITDMLIETSEEPSARAALEKERTDSVKGYEYDAKHERLFGDLFKSALTLIDNSDGVPRCGNCHWEAHGSVCLHCGTEFRIPREEAFYDLEGEFHAEEEDGNAAGSLDEYDSADSFVDSRGLEEINGDLDSDDYDILSSDNEAVAGEWHGFADCDGTNANSPIVLSGDESEGSYYNSQDLILALDEFHDENVQASTRRHGVINISDDENDDF